MFTTIELVIMYIITLFMIFALLSKCLDIIKTRFICKTLECGMKTGALSRDDFNKIEDILIKSYGNVQNKGGK